MRTKRYLFRRPLRLLLQSFADLLRQLLRRATPQALLDCALSFYVYAGIPGRPPLAILARLCATMFVVEANRGIELQHGRIPIA